MPDIIQLLPDSVANQIAAGEVVQRPASAVKELLENSIDAGSTEITLNIKDAGKTLIQVIDNGSGMSITDARLCMERHATSKIRSADDLFSIRTMGFRGEAMPSMAAISQMELKTKKHDEDVGTHIIIEAGKLISQEVCQCKSGTNISIKNLFLNVPARRNFLKSNPVETKHIIEEFTRVALINPQVMMIMHNEGNDVFRLPASNFRQRICNIFGRKYDQRLVPVDEKTDIVSVSGFVGKPEFAKRTKGEQYFYVNNRFIKSPYLNHAVQIAFENLLPKDQFPSYFLKLDLDPAKIDINIHPTKTEIKLEEERAIYAILRTSVRQALGKYNISPSLDFEQETSFGGSLKPPTEIKMPEITINPDFNPFKNEGRQKQFNYPARKNMNAFKNPEWQKIFEQERQQEPETRVVEQTILSGEGVSDSDTFVKKNIQLHNKYILSHIKSGFIIVDQQRAHERVLYERLKNNREKHQNSSQKLLFPESIEFSTDDFQLYRELMDEIQKLGFETSVFGKNSIVIHSVPSDATSSNYTHLMEGLLEQYKKNLSELKLEQSENLLRSIAKNISLKRGRFLSTEEMDSLVDELFACEMPYHLPNGKPIIITYSLSDLDKQFKRI